MYQRGELEGSLLLGPWFSYIDENGLGHCQPDQLLVMSEKVLCFENKLTQTPTALTQLLSLYRPILESYYEMPVAMIQVCKNLKHEVKPAEKITHPYQAHAFTKRVYTWHTLR